MRKKTMYLKETKTENNSQIDLPMLDLISPLVHKERVIVAISQRPI